MAKKIKYCILQQGTVARSGIVLIFLFLPCLMFTAPLTYGAESSKIDALINEALSNNPELKSYRRRYLSKKAKVVAEGMLKDPMLRMELREISSDTPLRVDRSRITKLFLKQAIPFPGKLSLKEDIALKEALAAESVWKDKILDITEKVKKAYYDYYYVTTVIRITEDLKKIISHMSDIAMVKYSTGLVSQHDAIKAQVELSLLEKRLLDLRARREMVKAHINTLLNRKVDSELPEPEHLDARPVSLDISILRMAALNNNPGLLSLDYKMKSREQAVSLARKDYYPDFVFGMNFMQKDDMQDTVEAVFGINVPIWWSKYDSRVREKSAGASAARFRFRSGRNNLIFNLEMSYERFLSARDEVRLYENGLLPQTELSFSSAISNYETGKVDFITLLDNERALLNTRIGYAKAVTEYNKELAVMDRIVGRDISTKHDADPVPDMNQ